MSATVDVMRAVPGQVVPLRRADYDALVAAGAFTDDRVELLEGVLVAMSPQDPRHADAVRWLSRTLGRALPPELDLQVQLPLAAGDTSEPEPDLAVVPAGRYRDAHPDEPMLVIEVANTSQALDLGAKAALYARAGVPEYWVVDLPARAVVVHLDPAPAGYGHRTEHRGGVLAPVAVAAVAVDLGELFG